MAAFMASESACICRFISSMCRTSSSRFGVEDDEDEPPQDHHPPHCSWLGADLRATRRGAGACRMLVTCLAAPPRFKWVLPLACAAPSESVAKIAVAAVTVRRIVVELDMTSSFTGC